jgi:hypothetical protein
MAYAERTEVAFDKSIGDILKLVRKAGADQIGQVEDGRQFAVQFTLGNRMIRFRLPLHDPNSRRSVEQVRRQRGRALLLVIKAKLESVESGIETVEQAFLANVVMSDGVTVYERISTPIALEYQEGRPNAATGLLPPPRSSDQ